MPTDAMAEESRRYRELVRLLGCRPTPMTREQWLTTIERCLAPGRKRVVIANHNLHSVYQVQREPVVRSFYRRADYCYLDGSYMRWILAAGGVSVPPGTRVSLMDVFPDLLQRAEHAGWSVFYLGSRAPVVERAGNWIGRCYPALRIQLHHGYVNDSEAVIAQINRMRPDILLVGMGVPRQEAWLLEYLDRIDCGVAMESGATLDYFGAGQARPPRWLSERGLAWLYRLAHDPRRLWRRYLLEPWSLLPALIQLRLTRD